MNVIYEWRYYHKLTKERIHAFLTAVGIATAATVIMTSTIVTQVFAIKYFFNCMTDSANRHGKLTLDDIHKCLYKKYSVYRKLPYGTSFIQR
jgi:hypothetical protein